MMLKGKAELVQEWVLENSGTFETSRACNITTYGVYGKTIKKKLFASDQEARYIHLYHDTGLEDRERCDVEKKINRLTSFLKSHINQFKDFGPGQSAGKFVFFEEKMSVIELELKLCGYFVIVTSDKMTAKQALELYKGRDASEKLFLSDKTFLGNHCLRCGTDDTAMTKIFVEFVALIIRNRMYNYLKEALKEMAKKPKYMTVPAAIRELDKIEMARQLYGRYRLDHAITATQKVILKAFGLNDTNVKYRAEEISKRLETEI